MIEDRRRKNSDATPRRSSSSPGRTFGPRWPMNTSVSAKKRSRGSLARAIVELPERERQLLSLWYEHDLNLREIAAVLDIPRARVVELHGNALRRIQRATVRQSQRCGP